MIIKNWSDDHRWPDGFILNNQMFMYAKRRFKHKIKMVLRRQMAGFYQ